MLGGVVASRITARLAGIRLADIRLAGISLAAVLALSAMVAPSNVANAFPFIDATNADTVPTGAPAGTELPAQDVQGLQNQLRLVNPGAPGNQGPWTIIPRLTMQELFSDNTYEVQSPRRPDATTVIAPGINIAADTARLKMSLDYQPNLLMHAINGPLNVITQQLTLTGTIIVVPDLAYVDVRALTGVQSQFGALAGAGTLGAGTVGANGPAGGGTAGTGAIGTGEGLNRNNEVQTSSFGISPYLLRQFGDYGFGKLGVSANVAHYSQVTGFLADPLPGGGSAGQSALTTEQIAHYQSGEFLQKTQYAFDVDVSQSRNTNQAGTETIGTTTIQTPNGAFSSQRETITNTISYAVNHSLTVLATIGQQQITYSGGQAPPISGLTWSVGLTYAPTPNSSATITYGHLNGTNSITANGHFAVGGFSVLNFSYGNTVGTQLENLQNQLNNAAAGPNGSLINAQTGGAAFPAASALGVQTGVFRFNTFTASWTTQWPRDMLQATLTWSEQTSLNPGLATTANTVTVIDNTVVLTAGPSTTYETAMATWNHQISPDLMVSSMASYSFIRRNAGVDDGSMSTSVGLQYTLSPSTFLTGRYSFFDRVSKIPGYSLYENLLLLGFTKTF
jgi:hypothetical protein